MFQGIENTGERLIPGGSDLATFFEHIYRYAFACKLLSGFEILDIASGEGYGTRALSKIASRVMGIDIDVETVKRAREKYGLPYAVGTAERIPVESGEFEAAVSFETIEHIQEPEGFLKELFRILKPGGRLVISTPNKDVYHHGQEANPFHCSELTLVEFKAILTPYFKIQEIYGQIYPDQTPLEKTLESLGLKRMTRWLKNRFWPDFYTDRPAEVDWMLERIPLLSRPLDGFWNPYALRKITDSEIQKPKYLVIVAVKKR